MVETTLKTLINRFRSKPEWQHTDPAVRAAAVLRLPSSEQELLAAIAREDADPRVRRAASKKLSDAANLAAIVAADVDAGVREEAEQRLAHLAVHAQTEDAARLAVAGLRDARGLALVARGAPLAAVRQAAVQALSDPRALAAIVRESEDAATRLQALARIEDAPTLLALALNSENKSVAVAAVDRISEAEALRTIAGKARVGAAARRARARLQPAEGLPAPPAVSVALPSSDDEAERRAYEDARAAHEREAAARSAAVDARIRVAESLEGADGEAIPEAVERARQEQAGLAAGVGAEVEAADRRIAAALAAAGDRHAAFLAGAARRQELLLLVEQAEALAQADAEAARAGFAALEARWAAATAGVEAGDLRTRFEAVAGALQARRQAEHAEQSIKDQEQLKKLQRLAERVASLLQQGVAAPLREADHALRELKDALEHPGHLPTRRDRDAVLARLESARKQLYPLVQQLREDAGWKRWANVSVQEELCARAEALLDEPDAEQALRELRELDARWKQAKEAPKEQAEALWTRFKSAHELIKARADALLAKQAEQLAENLVQKEALCERAEALAESGDWLRTAEELRTLQARWKAIGPVPRAVSQRVWERFRKPCDRFFTRWQEHRSQRSQEWAGNLARKEALCERAEALRDSTDWEGSAGELKRLQAEWRTIGAVKKTRSEAVWQRFRAACDHFFDRYKNRDAHARQAAESAREMICAELEGLLPEAGAGERPADLAARLLAAQTAWRQAGGLPQDRMTVFDERFGRARDRLLEAFPRAFEGTDLDPEASRGKAERIVSRLEALLQELAPEAGALQAQTAQELAARLRDALATNTIGGRAAVEARWQSAAGEVESAVGAWKRLGPLPGAAGREIAERFERACRRFAEARPRSERPRSEPPRPGAGRRPREAR